MQWFLEEFATMKRIFLLLMVALLGSYATVNTYAGDQAKKTQSATTNFNEDYVNRLVPLIQVYDDLTLEGTIAKLNRSNGSVELKTDEQGDVKLQFRPAALGRLNVGDPVVVYLGFGVNERTINAESCSALPIKLSTC